MEKVVERFTASDDEGRSYTVVVRQRFINASTKDGPEFLPGLKTMQLTDGRHVNFVDENTFDIVGRPMIRIRRVG